MVSQSHSILSFYSLIPFSHSIVSFHSLISLSHSIVSFHSLIPFSHFILSFHSLIPLSHFDLDDDSGVHGDDVRILELFVHRRKERTDLLAQTGGCE